MTVSLENTADNHFLAFMNGTASVISHIYALITNIDSSLELGASYWYDNLTSGQERFLREHNVRTQWWQYSKRRPIHDNGRFNPSGRPLDRKSFIRRTEISILFIAAFS